MSTSSPLRAASTDPQLCVWVATTHSWSSGVSALTTTPSIELVDPASSEPVPPLPPASTEPMVPAGPQPTARFTSTVISFSTAALHVVRA